MCEKNNDNGFPENSFWKKLKKYAKQIGREGVERILQLYYVTKSPDTPAKIKIAIYGALAYLILTIDAVPDFLPFGFTDDLTAIATVYILASVYITPEIEKQAKEKVAEWFGEEEG